MPPNEKGVAFVDKTHISPCGVKAVNADAVMSDLTIKPGLFGTEPLFEHAQLHALPKLRIFRGVHKVEVSLVDIERGLARHEPIDQTRMVHMKMRQEERSLRRVYPQDFKRLRKYDGPLVRGRARINDKGFVSVLDNVDVRLRRRNIHERHPNHIDVRIAIDQSAATVQCTAAVFYVFTH